jgi:uncharacterized protein (TIGR02996 family)
MSSDEAFLRVILASPGDGLVRSAYADWMEERGDPRAHYLRTDTGVERINCVDWLRDEEGILDYYLPRFPEIARQAEESRSYEQERKRLRSLRGRVDIDAGWLAFMDSLGRPFHPFLFWNYGTPQAFQPEELPFTRRVGTRGSVITFEGEFLSDDSWDPGLPKNLLFLSQLNLKSDCATGAARCPVHPFLCELPPGHRPPDSQMPASGRPGRTLPY